MAENGTAETVRPESEGAGTGVFSAPARELFAARRGDEVRGPADVDAAADLVRTLARRHGFAADVGHLVIPGRCRACDDADSDPDSDLDQNW